MIIIILSHRTKQNLLLYEDASDAEKNLLLQLECHFIIFDNSKTNGDNL